MMKAAGGFGSRWMTDLINNIVKECCIPDDWRKSILVPVYKGKRDPLVCGSYRAIKLLEQAMKVLERVLEKSIRCQVEFGFMPGKGTTDAIFIMVRWYGHVMRNGDEDWVKRCMECRVKGRRPVGRPRKTWLESVESDMAKLEIDKEDVHDRSKWTRIVNVMKRKSNPIGKRTIN